MTKRTVLLSLGLLLSVSACSSAQKADDTSDEVVPMVLRGTMDRRDPAVVAVSSNNKTCTGSVIAPRYVLTAAHCITGWSDTRRAEMRVTFESPSSFGVTTTAVAHVYRPEKWNYRENDLAVLELATSTKVTPIPLALDAGSLDQIDRVRIVGYGLTGAFNGDGGRKREGEALVRFTNDYVKSIPGTGGTCFGDSGGPALAYVGGKETIVGVTSHGLSSHCEGGTAFVRTDRHREFLARFVDAPRPATDDRVATDDSPPPVEPPVQKQEVRSPITRAPEPPTITNGNDGTMVVENGGTKVTMGPNGITVVTSDGHTIQTRTRAD